MPINIVDLADAQLLGQLTFKEFQREWLAQWLMPLMQIVVARQEEKVLREWDKISPELHDTMEQDFPEQYAQAIRSVTQMRKQFE
jgi:hypothetical protein